ncbi:tyrosine-type recombinase/integrase [bacterium]|nr:tyrosine-type recombinase/integrase [bacterium]
MAGHIADRGSRIARLLQKVVAEAVRKAGIAKHAPCHTFPHSFATHLLEGASDIRTVQELFGHKDVKTVTQATENEWLSWHSCDDLPASHTARPPDLGCYTEQDNHC